MELANDPRVLYIRTTAEACLDADSPLFDALITDKEASSKLQRFLEGGAAGCRSRREACSLKEGGICQRRARCAAACFARCETRDNTARFSLARWCPRCSQAPQLCSCACMSGRARQRCRRHPGAQAQWSAARLLRRRAGCMTVWAAHGAQGPLQTKALVYPHRPATRGASQEPVVAAAAEAAVTGAGELDAGPTPDTRSGDQQGPQLEADSTAEEASSSAAEKGAAGSEEQGPSSDAAQPAPSQDQSGADSSSSGAIGGSTDPGGGGDGLPAAAAEVQQQPVARQELLLSLEPLPEQLAGCRCAAEGLRMTVRLCVAGRQFWSHVTRSALHADACVHGFLSVLQRSLPTGLCRTFFCLHAGAGPVPMEHPEDALQCGELAAGPSLRSLEQVGQYPCGSSLWRLASLFCWGLTAGHVTPIHMLIQPHLLLMQLLADVYLPLLVQQATEEARAAGGGLAGTTAAAIVAALGGGGGGSSSRELLATMQKYLGQVSQALQHLHGDVALQIPDIRITSPRAAAADPDTMEALEEVAAGWSAALSALMQGEGEKRPGGKGPVAEVEFWRARSAVLSGVSEQLALPRVQEMLEALEAGSVDRQLLSALRGQMVELDKLATEVSTPIKHVCTPLVCESALLLLACFS